MYTFLFVAELIMRVSAAGCGFFISEDWWWALVDVIIVAGALLDLALDIVESLTSDGASMVSGIDGVSSLKARSDPCTSC